MNLRPWQQPNWAHLQQYIRQGRIPQALLMTGKKGVGKQQLAQQFANALVCQQPQADALSCGTCPSCVLFTAGNHPDIMAIQPEESSKNIGIDQIRRLISRLGLKPQFEKYRVVLINPADAMNTAAANAFLKCLEEPTERTVILLLTDKPGKLPATISSRCQKLAITNADTATSSAWLKQQNPGISDSDTSILLALAQNAPLLALTYAQQNTLKQRNDCFQAWQAIAKQQAHPIIVAETWQNLPETSLLLWLTSWVMDTIKCAYQSSAAHLSNPDLHKAMQTLAQGLELKKLFALYDLLLLSRQRLDTTVNKQVLFEEILIHWSTLTQGK